MADVAPLPHRWRFFRSGGFDQVRLETSEDLVNLGELDPKLWSVLGCPTAGLEFDRRTLELIDADGDGYVRVPDILRAVGWACAMLRDPGQLTVGEAALPLAAINASTPEGANLLASARRILASLGKADAPVISVDESSDSTRIFDARSFNGDGVVPPELCEDAEVRAVMRDIIDCFGPEADRSGEPGVSRDKSDEFFSAAEAFLGAWRRARADASVVFPLGDATAAAVELFESVRTKVDDYFSRCRLAGFDPRAATALNPGEEVYARLHGDEISTGTEAVSRLPLARVSAGRPLVFDDTVNPAWAGRMDRFRREVVQPLLGERTELAFEDWERVSARLQPYRAWAAENMGTRVASLGAARIEAILESRARDVINGLIDQDKALKTHAEAIDSVERLARYHRDLFTLLNNFVSLRDFYGRGRRAIFQAGTLYLDRRGCELCLRVDDINRHSALAHFSGTYLVYCRCERQSQPPMMIVAVLTDGDSDNLMVGRNGIFYDRDGRDWSASVVKLVEHPISVRQAFWSPYKRIARTVRQQVERFAATKDASLDAGAASGVAGAIARVGPGDGKGAPSSFDIAKFAGIFAAIGLAIGAIGTALAAMVAGLFSLAWWQVPLVMVGLLFAVSGPSMLLAWLKLRQRNLAPLLDASGWAVNTRARINLPFGTSLTSMAVLPPGSQRALDDPYAEKRRPWKLYLLLLAGLFVVAALWQQGYLDPLFELGIGWFRSAGAGGVGYQ